MANEINIEEQTTEVIDYDKEFSKENAIESNWFKFNKIGDQVTGKLIKIEEKPAQGIFGAQKVYTLETKTDEFIKVGIPVKKGFLVEKITPKLIDSVIRFKLDNIIPSKIKGQHDTKSINVYLMSK